MERYNPWWDHEPDTELEKWKKKPVKWVPAIVNSISLDPFSFHFITGPRQVGKTTALKILINNLLEKRDPKSIFYYSCDQLNDHRELGEILDNYISSRSEWGINKSIIILDEITFVSGWWRAVKSRIDNNLFSSDVLVVTGSLSVDILKQKEMFPGRRGKGHDYILYPLDFPTYSRILGKSEIKREALKSIDKAVAANRLFGDSLAELFSRYMMTGGFPPAIQDYKLYGKVTPETERTYLDWMKGDWNKANKSDRYMKEILSYIVRARGTPVSWNGVSRETSIDSPHTAISYAEVLEAMYVLRVLHMIRPDGRVEYKKNKKLHLSDPFLIRLISNYTGQEYLQEWALEATVASHLSRFYETYYWRNKTECDVVCLSNNKQFGFEVTRGIKRWKPPWHLKKSSHLLDRGNIHLYLSALK